MPHKICNYNEKVIKVEVYLGDNLYDTHFPLDSNIICEDSDEEINIESYEGLGYKMIWAYNHDKKVCLVQYKEKNCEVVYR